MTDDTAQGPNLPGHIEESIRALAQVNAEHHLRARPIQRIVDRSVRLVGRPRFLVILTAFFAIWLVLNSALGHFGEAFDAPPFPILQGVAQLGALYITVLILITQRHEDELSDHRQQLTLELALLGEQKNAKIVQLLEEMRRDNPMMKDRVDQQAEELSVPADPHQVLDAIKEKHGEMLATVDAGVTSRPSGGRGRTDPKHSGDGA